MTIQIPNRLQEALSDSITSGTFVDTKFWVFSRRSSRPGQVGVPKALFVNERVAKGVLRLGSCAAFPPISRQQTNALTVIDQRGVKENLRAGFPTNRKPYTNDYDYEDDSDLEEDDEEDILDDEPADYLQPKVTTEEPESHPGDVNLVEDSSTRADEPSDIISVSDLDSLFSESEAETPSSAHVGRVVVIEDVAFITSVGFVCS